MSRVMSIDSCAGALLSVVVLLAAFAMFCASGCNSTQAVHGNHVQLQTLTIAIDGGHEADADYNITLCVRHQGKEVSAHVFVLVQTTVEAIAHQLKWALESKGISVRTSSVHSPSAEGVSTLEFRAEDALVGTSLHKVARGGANDHAGNVTLRMIR